MSRRRARLAVAVAVAPLAVVAVPPGFAAAHTEVVSTSPRSGSTRSVAPRTVRVAFSQQIRGGRVQVTDARGRAVQRSSGRDPRDVRRLRAVLRRGLGAGRYRVAWSITAADGHAQRGSFRFRVR